MSDNSRKHLRPPFPNQKKAKYQQFLRYAHAIWRCLPINKVNIKITISPLFIRQSLRLWQDGKRAKKRPQASNETELISEHFSPPQLSQRPEKLHSARPIYPFS
jgi:hypothetical protein